MLLYHYRTYLSAPDTIVLDLDLHSFITDSIIMNTFSFIENTMLRMLLINCTFTLKKVITLPINKHPYNTLISLFKAFLKSRSVP